jgi:hypothetical protein
MEIGGRGGIDLQAAVVKKDHGRKEATTARLVNPVLHLLWKTKVVGSADMKSPRETTTD